MSSVYVWISSALRLGGGHAQGGANCSAKSSFSTQINSSFFSNWCARESNTEATLRNMSTDISISKQSYRAPIFGTIILGQIFCLNSPLCFKLPMWPVCLVQFSLLSTSSRSCWMLPQIVCFNNISEVHVNTVSQCIMHWYGSSCICPVVCSFRYNKWSPI